MKRTPRLPGHRWPADRLFAARTLRWPVRCVLGTLVAAAAASAAPAPEQAELAERLLQAGQRLAAKPDTVRVAAALADAADRLYENDPRLLRTEIDLRLALGQRDAAITALNAYRKLDPGDQIAQVQSIDLQQSKMQSATERADYLTRVAGSDKVPAEVRAHAAVLLANVEAERGRDDAAMAAVDQALGLNPLNPKALQMKADAVAASGTAPQRAAALVNLLLADPLQFATVSRLAEELQRAGAGEAALGLYKQFFDALESAGYGPGIDDAINYATLQSLAGQARDADDVITAALKDHPGDTRLAWTRVLLARQAGDAASATSALADARGLALSRLMHLHADLDASAPRMDEGTVPALPDVKADAAALAAKNDAALTEIYLHALGDLAWVDAYFGRRAPDAPVAEAIDTLAGVDSPLAHRLKGFAALAAGKNDEAEVTLSAVAARDALSQLGLLAVRLAKGQDKAAVVADGNALLGKLSTDVWQLTVRQTLKDAGPLAFRAPDADAVAAAAAKLPAGWLGFAGNGRSYYLVSVDPVKGNLVLGEPMVVRVQLQNIGPRPLAIGPGGAVAQQVAIDANVRSAGEQSFPGVATAKMTGRLVLRPRETTAAVVRVDSGEVEAFASAVPQVAASVFVSAVANPVQKPDGIAPGPGGQRNQSRGVFDRPQVAFTRPEVRQQLQQQLADPDAVKRLHAVSAIAACGRWVATNEATKPLAATAQDMLQQAAQHDASSTVRAAALQELSSQLDEAGRAGVIKIMLASKDFESRLLGCMMMSSRPKAERAAVLGPLAGDADPVIAALATSIPQVPERAPATAPASPGAAPEGAPAQP